MELVQWTGSIFYEGDTVQELTLKNGKTLRIDEITGRQLKRLKKFRTRFDVSIFQGNEPDAEAIEAFIDHNLDVVTEILSELFGESPDFYLDLPITELVSIVFGLIRENYESLKNLQGSLKGFGTIMIQIIASLREQIAKASETVEKEVKKTTGSASTESSAS